MQLYREQRANSARSVPRAAVSWERRGWEDELIHEELSPTAGPWTEANRKSRKAAHSISVSHPLHVFE